MTVSGRPDAGNARRGDSRRLPQSVTPPPLRQHPQSAGTAAGSRGPRAGGDHPSGRERPAHERGHCHREAAGPPQRTGSRAWAPPRRPRCRCDAPVTSDLSFVDRTVLRRRLNYLRPLKVGNTSIGPASTKTSVPQGSQTSSAATRPASRHAPITRSGSPWIASRNQDSGNPISRANTRR